MRLSLFCFLVVLVFATVSHVAARSATAVVCNYMDQLSGAHTAGPSTNNGQSSISGVPSSLVTGGSYQIGFTGTVGITGYLLYAIDNAGNHVGAWTPTGTSQNDAGNCARYGDPALSYPPESLIQQSAGGSKGTSISFAFTAPTTAMTVTFQGIVMTSNANVYYLVSSNAVSITPPTVPGQTTIAPPPTTAPPPTVPTTKRTTTTTTPGPTAAPTPYAGCTNVGMVNGTVVAPKEGMTLSYLLDTANCVFTWTLTAPSMPAGGWMSVGICGGATMASGCDYLMAWFDSAGNPQIADTYCNGYSSPTLDNDPTANGGPGTGNFELVSGSQALKQITVKRPFYTGDKHDQILTAGSMSVQFSTGPSAPTGSNATANSFGYHGTGVWDAAVVNFYSGAVMTDTMSMITAGAWVCIFVSIAIGVWGVIRWSRKCYKEIRHRRMLAHFKAVGKDTAVANTDVVLQINKPYGAEMKMAADEGSRFATWKGNRPPPTPAPQVLNDNSRAVQLWRSKWQPMKDNEGNTYYFNEEQYTTSWEIPPMPDYFAAANAQSLPPTPTGVVPSSSASRLGEDQSAFTFAPGRAQSGWQQKAPPLASAAARHQRTKSVNSAAMVAKEGSSGQRSIGQLVKSFWAWRLPGTASSMSDAMVFAIYLAANAIAYFVLDNTTAGGTPDNKNKLGYLAAGNLLIVALPATRNSILVWFLGFPFDRVIVFHRWIGRFAILLVLLHLIYYLQFWNQNGITASSQLSIDTNTYGVIAFAMMLFILVTSFGWLRRNYFNMFFYSHFIFIFAYFFTYLHVKTQFYPYLVALIAIYGLDRLIRFVLGLQVHQTVMIAPKDGDIIQVRFPKNCIGKALNRYKIGQYVFINFPQLSLFEWHPFTLSSSPREVTAEVHIRSLGDHTKKLMEYVKGKNASMKIRVDGPYGNHRFTYRRYPALVLVGGGIGITPIVAILRDVFNVGDFSNPEEYAPSVIDAIYVSWVVPSIDKYKWFKQEFEECWRKLSSESTRRMPALNIWIYASRSSQPECQQAEQEGMQYGSATQFLSGKPDFDAMLNLVREKHPNTAVSVFACGPQQLTGDVWDASNQQKSAGHRFDFHHETFDW